LVLIGVPQSRRGFLKLLLAILACAVLALPAAEARLIHILYTGDPYPGRTPYPYMKMDPMLRVTPIQASQAHYAGISQEDIRRSIRQYMPRTYDELVEDYQVIIISDSNVNSFLPEHLAWFHDAVNESGLGLVMVGGFETFGARGYPDWGATPVGSVLPVTTQPGRYLEGRVRIKDYQNPFIKSLPFSDDLPFMKSYPCNLVRLRLGADLLAEAKILETGELNPFLAVWMYGRGRTFAMTGDWTPGGGMVFMEWKYYPDFVSNLMIYLAQDELPENLAVVHSVRRSMQQFSMRRNLLFREIDFIERFGANTRPVLKEIEKLDLERKAVDTLYLNHEFDSASERLSALLDRISEIESLAARLRDRALFWIYLVEWLAVTGAALLAGVAVWSLMVRKRLYREVGVTAMHASR